MNKNYFTNFDTLRFIACAFVFFDHIAMGQAYYARWYLFLRTHFHLGDIGVNFFFVLSGFLITTILLRSAKSIGGVNIKDFYNRRIKRIWPVYFTLVFIRFFLFPLILALLVFVGYKGSLDSLTALPMSALPWYMFFVANFYLISHNLISSPILIPLWTISVEEQFYFVWPFVVKFFKSTYITISLILIIGISAFFRYRYAELSQLGNRLPLLFSTFSVMGSLAVGSFGSFILEWYPKLIESLQKIQIKHSVMLYGSFIALVAGRTILESFFGDNNPTVSVIVPFLLSLVFLGIVLEQAYGEHQWFHAGKNATMTWLGKRSYGLYTYHILASSIIIQILKFFHIITINNIFLLTGTIISMFLVTVGLTQLSYLYIEKPILNL